VTKRDEWLLSLLDDPTPDNAGVFADWLDDHEECPLAGWLRGASHPVALAWAVFRDWLNRHYPTMLALLHDPADEAAIDRLEQRIGRALPEDFKASYRVHDGSDDDAGVLIGLPVMSLEEVGQNWENWADVADCFAHDELNHNYRSIPPGAVKRLYASRGWVPFVGDGVDYIALDFDPGRAGIFGQIIDCGRNIHWHHAIAGTVTEFFLFVARQYVLGKVGLSPCEDDLADPHQLAAVPEKEDLFNAVHDLLGFGPITQELIDQGDLIE
jgi:cell wall assembly regulator SMI1